MTPEQTETVRQKIQAAIDAAPCPIRSKAWGVTLASDKWEVTSPELGCCPLGAVLLIQPAAIRPASIFKSQLMNDYLKVTATWACGFINAFDGSISSSMDADYNDGHKMGEEFRAKICP